MIRFILATLQSDGNFRPDHGTFFALAPFAFFVFFEELLQLLKLYVKSKLQPFIIFASPLPSRFGRSRGCLPHILLPALGSLNLAFLPNDLK